MRTAPWSSQCGFVLSVVDRYAGGRRRIEQLAAERELGSAVAVGKEAVVPDAMEAVRQCVEQEPADELVCREGHDVRPGMVAVILPAESDLAVRQADKACIGDRDAMRVAAEIGQHLFRAAEGWFGIDDPLDPPQLIELAGEGGGFGERCEFPKKPSWPAANAASSSARNSRRKRRESTRTGRKKPGRQATQRVPSSDGPPPGTTQWTCG